ncbi:unnamed protein product [Arabidopsis halleri]
MAFSSAILSKKLHSFQDYTVINIKISMENRVVTSLWGSILVSGQQ